MLYLGIDQHGKQLTVDLGDEQGNLVLHKRVSTRWEPLRAFLDDVRRRSESEGGYVVILEVCGFNDYLLKLLDEYGCREIVLVQPEGREVRKTDRRDARRLREMLWVNRHRIEAGGRIPGLRRVLPATPEDAASRQLTAVHRRLTNQRTRTINRIHHLLMKHNLQHDCPTKGLKTKTARAWLAKLELPPIDRLEMDHLLSQWTLWDEQLAEIARQIGERQRQSRAATTLASIPGMSAYGSLAVASRTGPIERFRCGASLANFWGLAPGCRNSADTVRTGSITKQGSSQVRYLLGQVVLHVLRKDPWLRRWYQRIKRRRGTNIARVAVMRRLATIIWSMLKHDMPYITGGPEKFRQHLALHRQPLTTQLPQESPSRS